MPPGLLGIFLDGHKIGVCFLWAELGPSPSYRVRDRVGE